VERAGRNRIARACLVAAAFLLSLGARAQQADLATLLQRYAAQPNDYGLCQAIGVAYTRAEQLEKASEFFRKALLLKPDFLPARKNLATVLWFLNRKQESEREFQALVKMVPNDPVPHLYLGLAAHGRQQYQSAVTHFEKSGDLALDNPEVLPLLADAYDHLNAPDKAYAAYRRWLAAAPDSADAYASFAAFAAAHANNGFALQVLEQGLKRMPGSAKLLLEQGIILAQDGKDEQAAISFRQAGERDPQWSLPPLALGVHQLARGQLAAAAASFRKAIERAPKDDRAHYLLATALKGDPHRHEEMVAALQKAIDLNGRNARARVALADFYVAADRLSDAVSQLEQAVAGDPQNATALYQLGLAYRRQGQSEKSRQALQKFQAAKAKTKAEETELVQILKTVPAAERPR
jgi:tetratricopeptide (TPR) repeat protein